jgi:hypothetical protein
MQLRPDIEGRFHVSAGGGRPTHPQWTERRFLPLAPRTLERLEAITARIRKHGGVNVEPMQLAAVLLENTIQQIRRMTSRRSCVAADARADEPHLRAMNDHSTRKIEAQEATCLSMTASTRAPNGLYWESCSLAATSSRCASRNPRLSGALRIRSTASSIRASKCDDGFEQRAVRINHVAASGAAH